MKRWKIYLSLFFIQAWLCPDLYAQDFTLTVEKTSVTCKGDDDGTATLTSINGGTAPYTITWKDLNTVPNPVIGNDSTVSDLAPGSYLVTVVDDEGKSGFEVVTIEEWYIVFVSVDSTDISCFGENDGQILVLATGLHGGLEYSIDSGQTYQSSSLFPDLSEENYDLFARDSKGCVQAFDENPVTISEPSVLTVSIDGSSVLDLTCYGDTDGAININVSGGTPGYTYSWTGPSFSSTDQDISNLGAGKYVVTVQDTNLCAEYDSATVAAPPEILIQTDSINDVSCNGAGDGSIGITVSGGVPKSGPLYDYSWSSDLGFSSTSRNISNLEADNYYLQVTDDIGCTDSTGAIAIEEPAPVAVTTDSTQNILCFGDSTGSIYVTVTGGNQPYDLLWSGPGGFSSTEEDLVDIPAGNYSLQVTDASLCTYNHGPVTLTEASRLTIALDSSRDITCNGLTDGAIYVTPDGGEPGYDYSWTSTGGFSSTERNLTGLAADDYILIVTDTNGCTLSSGVITVSEPAPLSVTVDTSGSNLDLECFGDTDGAIDVIVSGGTPGYDFSWSGPDAFSASSEDLSNLKAGDYTLNFTDTNNCVPAPITVSINEPPVFELSLVDSSDISCYGTADGKIIVSAAGGTEPYGFAWTGPDSYTSSEADSITGLQAGVYDLMVTDARGCRDSIPATTINEADSIYATVEPSSVLVIGCSGDTDGRLIISVGGGESPYTYSWSGPGGFTSVSKNITNLAAGAYRLDITDNTGCTRTYDPLATITELPALELTLEKQNVSCFGDANGSITGHASGGTPPYEFSRTAVTWQADSVFPGLNPGGYILFARDQLNCQTYDTAVINQPSSLYIGSEIKVDSNNICYGDSNGIIIINAGGGTPPLEYSIDSGLTYQSSNSFMGLPAGQYQTMVRDQNGCSIQGSNNLITQPARIYISDYTQEDISSCFDTPDGRIVIKAAGGEGIIAYTIDSSDTNIFGVFENLLGGSHLIEIEDDKGCVKDTSVIINRPPELAFNSITVVDVTGCNGNSNGSIEAAASGGTGSLEYALNAGTFQPGGTWSSLAAGEYTLTVQDQNFCTSDSTVSLDEPDTLGYSDLIISQIRCQGEENGAISITGSGGTAPHTYTLNPGSVSNSSGLFEDLSPGSYTVEVTDDAGCPAYTTDTILLTDPPPLFYDSVASTLISCNGYADASINIFASGGVSPLSYSVDDGATYLKSGTFTGLGPGTYHTSVRDTNSCVIRGDTIELSDPPGITINKQTAEDINCHGDSSGIILIEATGGSGPLNYSWDSTNWQASDTLSALPSGNYQVHVRDSNHCIKSTDTLTISQSEKINTDIVIIRSINGQPGSIHVSSSGGTGDHEYSVNGLAGPFQSDTAFTGLWPGDYEVVARDELSCFRLNTVTLEAEPPLVISISDSSEIICAGDSAAAIYMSSVNGTGQVQYSVDGGTTLQNDSIFDKLTGGVYEVYAIDEDRRIYRDTVTIEGPDTLIITVDTVIQINCNSQINGEIHTHISGGTAPVDLQWSSNNGFSSNDSIITDLAAGIYELTVTDQNSCNATTGPISIEEPSELIITEDSIQQISCYGSADGAVFVSIEGGTGPYDRLWSGPGPFLSSSTSITDLDSGRYELTVTDARGCQGSFGPVAIAEPDSLKITVNPASNLVIDCYGDDDGRLDVSASGGTRPYTFNWSGPSGFSSNEQNISGLSGGSYNLLLLDANRCVAVSGNITIDEPPEINASAVVFPETCSYTSADGSITQTVSGGTPPYSYLWSGNEETKDLASLNTGSYSVVITDADDCSVSKDYQVGTLSGVEAFAGKDTAVCPGEQLILNGSGGDIYFWSPSAGLSNTNIPNPVVTVTDTTDYILTVSDQDGCIDADTMTIYAQPLLGIDAGNDTSVSSGQVITLSAAGGPFDEYDWYPPENMDDPGSRTPNLTVINPGVYYVTGTSSYGCEETDSLAITIPSGLTIYSGFTPNGDGTNDFWDIDNTLSYPGIIVEVYNRWGKQVFSSTGYDDSQRWDGTVNGKELPTGTYYYIVRLGEGEEPLTGTVTIVR